MIFYIHILKYKLLGPPKNKNRKLKGLDLFSLRPRRREKRTGLPNIIVAVRSPEPPNVNSTVKIHTGESKRIKIAKFFYTHTGSLPQYHCVLQPDSDV